MKRAACSEDAQSGFGSKIATGTAKSLHSSRETSVALGRGSMVEIHPCDTAETASKTFEALAIMGNALSQVLEPIWQLNYDYHER